ncbi:MAG: DUF4955 domain-containing protein [Clostridium sp.]|nr:DUF4955 domain-containing protein [Clostridium sp.]
MKKTAVLIVSVVVPCLCGAQKIRPSRYVDIDFSYAGYHHGECLPQETEGRGWKIFDVTEYGAIPNDGKSDREAFMKAILAATGKNGNPFADAVIYFPEGEYILHTSEDDVDGRSSAIDIHGGHLVVKGAGRGRTVLVMQDPCNLADPPKMWTSPFMLKFSHRGKPVKLSGIVEDSPEGTFSVKVESAAGINPGDYVCLNLTDNSPELIEKELAPYGFEEQMTDFVRQGVKVRDYHKVRSVKGNKVTFYEPLLHEVDAKYSWAVYTCPNYSEVGVEDLTFRGNAKDRFVHHGSWQDDGAFKIIRFEDVTDGWIRRCDFVSVSEGVCLRDCANCSAYDITFTGNRGHSSVYTEESSRSFVGAIGDWTSGAVANDPDTWREGTGQWHATGGSKPDMGNVFWRNSWGNDACFQCHATQPRATLIDCCKGGWVDYRQGGAADQCPNHLADLVIWNFESTVPYEKGEWIWWSKTDVYQKFLPPVIVGFHGEKCDFVQEQCAADAFHGTAVEPESLYEWQLKKRLGRLPGWVDELKNVEAAFPEPVGMPQGLDVTAVKKNASEALCGQLSGMSGIENGLFPCTTDSDGNVKYVAMEDWRSGFFPGCLWYMYGLTGDGRWKTDALKYTEMMHDAQYFTAHHDIGFLIGSSYLNSLRMTGDSTCVPVIVQAAKSLSTRFRDRAGVIQSWDVDRDWQSLRGWECPVIIDNMMNLEILFEASLLSGDMSFRKIAISHADRTMKNHFRPDGSCFHVVDYDLSTGKVRSRETGQGYSDDSSWSRGQSWALYGYTMCYRYTGDKKYLRHACKVAEFILGHPAMPSDLVPLWDFDAPSKNDAPRDASAAAVMASALYELDSYAPGNGYGVKADMILKSLSTDVYTAAPGANGNFILMHSVGSIPHGAEVDRPLVYADYYYLEALMRRTGVLKADL